MKNIFKLSALAVLAAGLLASCQEKEIAAPEVALGQTRTFTLTFAQPDTKVAISDAGKTTWEVGDEILIHGEGSENKAIVTLTAENILANGKKAIISFEGVEPYDRFSDRGYTSTFYAQYPASASEEGANYYYYSRFTKTNAPLMAGYNDGDDIVFYNLCGVISFKADVDYDSYVFEGNNGETVGYTLFVSRLAGKGEGNDPVLEWKYSHTTGALTSIEGVGAKGEVAYVGLPLGTNFEAGFKLTLKKGETEVAVLSTDKAVNVERGKLLPLGDITGKLEINGNVETDRWDYTASEDYLAEGNLWKPVFDAGAELVSGNIAGFPAAPVAIAEVGGITKKGSTYKIHFNGATSGDWSNCNFITPNADHSVVLKAGSKYALKFVLGANKDLPRAFFKINKNDPAVDGLENGYVWETTQTLEANTPKAISDEIVVGADCPNISFTLDFGGNPEDVNIYIKDFSLTEVKEPLKFAWRNDTVIEQMVSYKDPGAAHWYIDADQGVDFDVKVYLNNVETTEAVTVEKFDVGGGHVAINYAANESNDEKVWDIVVSTTADVEIHELHAKLEQGPYEYTDLAKLNADIIAANGSEITVIVDLSAGVEITKINGQNVFAQNTTGGVLLYGTGLESKGMDANGGNAIMGKFTVKAKTYKGLPEITAVLAQSEDAKIGVWSGQYPCFTRTIAEIEADYAKYVNAKCKIQNVEVTKAFGATKLGEIKDASASISIYNYSTDLTENVPVGAKAEYAIVWPTIYDAHQLGFYKASQLKLTSVPGVVTVAATMSVAVGSTVELGATTNSTGALSYESLDESIATVENGVVTGVAAGQATIKVSVAADGIYTAGSAECVVTVTDGSEPEPNYVIVWKDEFTGQATSTTALSSLSGSYTGFTGAYTDLNKVYPMNNAIKVGGASAAGNFKTPALSTITGDNATLRVTVKAAGWNNKSATLQVATRNGIVSPDAAVAIASESTMSGNAPTMTGAEYVWTITGASAETAVQFTTNLAVGIDEILIEQLVPAE